MKPPTTLTGAIKQWSWLIDHLSFRMFLERCNGFFESQIASSRRWHPKYIPCITYIYPYIWLIFIENIEVNIWISMAIVGQYLLDMGPMGNSKPNFFGTSNFKCVKYTIPGDSKWPFDSLFGGHDSPFKGSRELTIPKRSPAELPILRIA